MYDNAILKKKLLLIYNFIYLSVLSYLQSLKRCNSKYLKNFLNENIDIINQNTLY